MKRLRGILFLLVAGAILNVLVAWGIAVTVDSEQADFEKYTILVAKPVIIFDELRGRKIVRNLYRGRRFGTMHVYAEEYQRVEDNVLDPTDESYVPAVPHWAQESIDAQYSAGFENGYKSIGRGWPFIALISHQRRKETIWSGIRISFSPENDDTVVGNSGIQVDSWQWLSGKPRVLPLRPVWRGFAANTAFYAALLWSPVAARRLIRRKRGRCTACGYDLRGNVIGGCPECGWGRAESSVE